MEHVKHPLDWWAHGGYAEVVRQTGWRLPKARREVGKAIKSYGWHPIGHAGYEELRRRIMDSEMTDRDLIWLNKHAGLGQWPTTLDAW